MRTGRARRLGAVAVAAAGLLALTACGSDGDGEGSSLGASGGGDQDGKNDGGSDGGGEDSGESLADLSPQEVSDRAEQALRSATSLRITMSGIDGEPDNALDLHLDREGSCAGSFTQAGQGTVELLVRNDEEAWMKPDTQFWQSQMDVAESSLLNILDGVYLHGTIDDPEMSAMAGMCSLADLQAEMGSGDGPGGPEEVGPVTEHKGVRVVTLTGKDEEGNDMTMLVADEGEPYPLLVRTVDNGAEAVVELSDYNKPVEIEEPPADKVLEVADFRSGDIEG